MSSNAKISKIVDHLLLVEGYDYEVFPKIILGGGYNLICTSERFIVIISIIDN
jgi:hypothetical protein